MDRYFGFDLGDAESAVTYLKKNEQAEPQVVPVREAGSFITAYARLHTGELLIGEEACYTPDAVERCLRFKSRFLTDPSSMRQIKSFAGGVLGELYMSGSLVKGEDCCFYIGCPAGWDRLQRERYREIFEEAGYPPVRVISESRAALISACQSRHFQVGYDILSRPVLVVDMGSSTTDFAYINSGREVELQTAGEVRLGGGIMDELLLDAAVESSPHREEIRRVFAESPPWRSFCEFKARRLKEKYFSDEVYWKDRDCLETVTIVIEGEGSSGSHAAEETSSGAGSGNGTGTTHAGTGSGGGTGTTHAGTGNRGGTGKTHAGAGSREGTSITAGIARLFEKRPSVRTLRLQLRMNGEMAQRLLETPVPQLEGRSFHEVFAASLQEIRARLEGAEQTTGDLRTLADAGRQAAGGSSRPGDGRQGADSGAHPGDGRQAAGGSAHPGDREQAEKRAAQMPELLFLTGGVSKMPALRAWCREAFPEAVVITGAEPEFSVSRGLAYSGRVDEEIRAFRQEVRDLVDSSIVERIVEEHVEDLFHRTVDTLVEPILRNAAIPVFEKWRNGEIRRLADIDTEMEREIDAWLHSADAADLLVKPITGWLRPVAYRLEEHTMPICVRHNVPYRALSFTSYLSLAEIDVHVNARDVFAVEELTWMVNAIISILVGLLCGGSGIALLSSGISGIIAGAMLTLLVLFLGREQMESAFMKMDIPVLMRKIVPHGYFEARMGKISGEIKKTCFETMEKEKSEEVARRMISEISGQIEECLMRMAEVVEIPLGK